MNVPRGLEKFNAEADPAVVRGRPVSQGKQRRAAWGSAGVETTAWIDGTLVNHGKPTTTVLPTTTDSPRGSGPVVSVTERLVVAKKPGNAGGAKGPQFKDQREQEQGRR